MDKAKQAVSGFMAKAGHKDTVVDQDQRAPVTEEHVRPQRHEETTTAINKEVHQDHHQTVVQPINHTETLAEKHTHNAVPVQHKTYEHDKSENTRAMVDADAARYRDSSVKHDTSHTTSKAPVVAGEETHHHLHQHVQPVIQKETIAPEVVHTTVPIHETHHAQSVNHGTTTLPAKTLSEFQQEQGGSHGRTGATGTSAHSRGDHNMADQAANRAYNNSDATGHNTSGATGASKSTKPSMMDKINPLKDADGDGKKGLMS